MYAIRHFTLSKSLYGDYHFTFERGLTFSKISGDIYAPGLMPFGSINNIQFYDYDPKLIEKFHKQRLIPWCSSVDFEIKDKIVSKLTMSFNQYDENDITGAIVFIDYPEKIPTTFNCSGKTIMDTIHLSWHSFIGILKEGEEIDIISSQLYYSDVRGRKIAFKNGEVLLISVI